MAGNYQNNKTEHAFVRIEKDMKSGNIPGLVLLCGQEDYLTDHYFKTLGDRLTDPVTRQMDLNVFERDQVEPTAILETCETLPLASEKKVVMLSGLIDRRGKLPKHLEENEEARTGLFECLAGIPEHAVLIISVEKPLTSGDYKKQSDGRRLGELKKKVKGAGGNVYDFGALDRDQLRNFVVKRFKASGKTCNRNVLQRIVYDTGYGSRYTDYDLYLLNNDLKKIIAASGEKDMVDEGDLAGTLTISPENNVFHMLDAIGRGRTDQALIDLNTLFSCGESEFGILANLIRQLELMLISRELQDENRSRGEILGYLTGKEKVGQYRAESVSNTASRFRRDDLKNMLSGAIAVEEHIKGGLMDGRMALEYFIAHRR